MPTTETGVIYSPAQQQQPCPKGLVLKTCSLHQKTWFWRHAALVTGVGLENISLPGKPTFVSPLRRCMYCTVYMYDHELKRQ